MLLQQCGVAGAAHAGGCACEVDEAGAACAWSARATACRASVDPRSRSQVTMVMWRQPITTIGMHHMLWLCRTQVAVVDNCVGSCSTVAAAAAPYRACTRRPARRPSGPGSQAAWCSSCAPQRCPGAPQSHQGPCMHDKVHIRCQRVAIVAMLSSPSSPVFLVGEGARSALCTRCNLHQFS